MNNFTQIWLLVVALNRSAMQLYAVTVNHEASYELFSLIKLGFKLYIGLWFVASVVDHWVSDLKGQRLQSAAASGALFLFLLLDAAENIWHCSWLQICFYHIVVSGLKIWLGTHTTESTKCQIYFDVRVPLLKPSQIS